MDRLLTAGGVLSMLAMSLLSRIRKLTVLKFSAGRIGSFDKDENAFVIIVEAHEAIGDGFSVMEK